MKYSASKSKNLKLNKDLELS